MFNFEEVDNMQELMDLGQKAGLFTRAVFGATCIHKGVHSERFAVVDGGTTLYPPEYNYQPISSESEFDIASITKTVVTLTWHAFQGKGLLTFGGKNVDNNTLVAPILDMRGDFVKTLTVGHLHSFYARFKSGHPTADVILKEGFEGLLMQLRWGGLVEEPGVVWKYANPHTILLGVLLERLTGKTLLECVNEAIVNPLGIYSFSPTPYANRHKLVMCGSGIPPGIINDPTARIALNGTGRLIGSAGLFASPKHLLVLLRMLLNGGVHEGQQIVAKSIVRNLHVGTTLQFGNGIGRWSKFRERMENLAVIDDTGAFKLGHTGAIIVVLPRYNLAYTILTDYLVTRSEEQARKDRPSLYQLFAAGSHKALLELMPR